VSAATTIALSLISHTNAGKTTLARTLLGRDVGEVRDAAHVTTEASVHPLIDTAEGDALVLWDTPGFGNSARLAARLSQQGNPIGWFLAQVWDRFRDRAFWLTQQAVRNVRERADIVLYLVNASESPADAGYLAHELAVLDWTGKPVIALLNQMGPPRAPAEEAVEAARWRDALARWPQVQRVIALDAFARCWVQELTLFDAVAKALPAAKQPAFARLAGAWKTRRTAQFDAAMAALAPVIAEAACDRVVLPPDPLLAKLGRSLGMARAPADRAATVAERAMAARVEAGLRAATDRLLALHELRGRAAADVLARVRGGIQRNAPMDEAKSAVMGGLVTGALTGLTADLATGGLTLGGGMLAGAVLGALGGAGVARGLNVANNRTDVTLTWSVPFLDALVVDAVLRYLAVAHYGRGRGDWHEGEYAPFWRDAATAAVAAHAPALAAIWSLRSPDCTPLQLEGPLCAALRAITREVLAALYPESNATGDVIGAAPTGPGDAPAHAS